MSSRNMTIPSRPAPPPPQASSGANKTNRYSPATNWDDTPFSPQNSASSHAGAARVPMKKPPPPRPPPPKVVPALKKPGQPQSINILSNLFGQKRNTHGGAKTPVNAQKGQQLPMKLPPPPKLPPPAGHHNPNYGALAHNTMNGPTGNGGTDMQLITFDSPPSSPTFTQKSCSDCISVDSFSSDSNYSSPNNGSMSQAESGFEDDFVSQHESQRSKATTPASSIAATPSSSSGLKDLWDLSDPFGMPPSAAASTAPTHNGHSHYAPVGSATIRAPAVNSKLYEQDFVDPLCNGKSVASRVQTVAMPTIIKAATTSSSSSQKSTPVHGVPKFAPWTQKAFPPPVAPAIQATPSSFEDDPEETLDSLPSPPMPNIPPPPPPVVCTDEPEEEVLHHEQPYGIAMYDFNGETDEDLGFRINDKIYLLKRLNEEWLLGRDRRGCEGMFPANYIEVRVPLAGDSPAVSTTASSSSNKHGDISPSATSSFKPPQVRVLYTFNAETADDLTIVENEFVTVLHQITPEWLYGECHGQRGQFPANFIEYVPANLPAVATA